MAFGLWYLRKGVWEVLYDQRREGGAGMSPSTYPRRSDYDSLEEYYEAIDAWYDAADQYTEEYYERTRD